MTRAANPQSPVAYRLATQLVAPLVPAFLQRRARRGKEDPARINERLGKPSHPRPDGPLVWLHAASVGESLSVLALIERLRDARPDMVLLVTTGTVTSAQLMHGRLPQGCLHQYVPVDTPAAVSGFLDHWQPDYALLVESELWPNLITMTRARGIGMSLVNARMSERSARSWKRRYRTAHAVLSCFDTVLAQDETAAARYRSIGAPTAKAVGNLKVDAPPPPASGDLMGNLTRQLAGRTAWIAASTHTGEERVVAQAHALLRQAIPGLLTVIVPRHPERGDEIAAMLATMNLAIAQRSRKQSVTGTTDIYLADTLGELGGFFRILTIVFMGGSLVRAGGHNPIEPALLGAALVTGPHIHNFADIYATFISSAACETVRDAPSLAAAIGRLMSDGVLAGARVTAAAETAGSLTGALEATLADILPRLDAALPKAVKMPTTQVRP